MKQILLKFSLFIITFFGAWFLAFHINWMEVFEVQENKNKLEEKLGEMIWENMERTFGEIEDDSVIAPIDSILTRICAANYIDRDRIKLHVVESNLVNAVALPDDYMIVFQGLIEKCNKEEELAGVIGHELAHLQLNHIMKKLIREIGISALTSASSGSEALKTLTSTAFSRELESEADLKSVDYLINADINPEGLADFMYIMTELEPDFVDYFQWISSHPTSEDRSETILEYLEDLDYEDKGVLTDKEWEGLKKAIANY